MNRSDFRFAACKGTILNGCMINCEKRELSFPVLSMAAFRKAASWSTDLRYETQGIKLKDSEEFLRFTKLLIDWVDRSI